MSSVITITSLVLVSTKFSYWPTRLLILHRSSPEITEKYGVSAHLYADDTQLYLPVILTNHDAQEAVLIMENCIDDISKWMSLHKVKLNEEKTVFLIVLPIHQIHKCNIYSINIGGCEVMKSDCVKTFGIQFDFSMQMKCQVNSIATSWEQLVISMLSSAVPWFMEIFSSVSFQTLTFNGCKRFKIQHLESYPEPGYTTTFCPY